MSTIVHRYRRDYRIAVVKGTAWVEDTLTAPAMTDEEEQSISEDLFADRKKATQEWFDGLMAANIEQTKTAIVTREKMEKV